MKYYKGYPIVVGYQKNASNLKAKCPYCGNIEHFHYSSVHANPTRRQSHCLNGYSDYYYIYIPKKRKEVKRRWQEVRCLNLKKHKEFNVKPQ